MKGITVGAKVDVVDTITLDNLSKLFELSREKIAEEVLGLWIQEQRVALAGGDWITDTLHGARGISLHTLV